MNESFVKLPPKLLRLLSLVYGVVIVFRDYLYNHKLLPTFTVPIPVVSVGNVTVGGTGKTPFVMWLAQQFKAIGLHPVVISRGYGGRLGNLPVRVPSDGKHDDYGDEPCLMARSLPDVPVVISRNRVRGALWSIERFRPDCIILDDGFQHRRLNRTLDIVMHDSRRPFTGDALLPRGRLRETISSLKRADIVIFTHCDGSLPSEADLDYLNNLVLPPPIFISRHIPVGLRKILTKEYLSGPFGSEIVALISAIGSPSGFQQSVRRMGLVVGYEKHYSDHQVISRKEWLRQTCEAQTCGCSMVVTTSKDESRYEDYFEIKIPVCVLDIALEIDAGEDLLSEIRSRIRSDELE